MRWPCVDRCRLSLDTDMCTYPWNEPKALTSLCLNGIYFVLEVLKCRKIGAIIAETTRSRPTHTHSRLRSRLSPVSDTLWLPFVTISRSEWTQDPKGGSVWVFFRLSRRKTLAGDNPMDRWGGRELAFYWPRLYFLSNAMNAKKLTT